MLFTNFSVLHILMAGLLFWVAWQFSRRQDAPGRLPLTLLLAVVAEWVLSAGFEAAAVGLPAKLTLSKLQYLGITTSPVLFFWFGYEFYTQKKLKFRPISLLLWVLPAVTLLLAATNEFHHLVWSSVTLLPDPAANLAVYNHGFWFWVHITFYYVLVFIASILLIQSAVRFRHIYRHQAIAILLGIPLPWIGNILYIFGLGNPGEDLTAIGFGATGLIFAITLRWLQFLDLVPVARDRVIECMDNCLIVVDRQMRVVDANPAVASMLAQLRPGGQLPDLGELIGQPVSQTFSMCPHLVEHLRKGDEGRFELRVHGDQRYFDLELRISAIHDPARGHIGWMAILNDITDLKLAREEALEARDRALQAAAENTALFEQMRHMALTDPLTGLSTRRHFFNQAVHAFEWALKNNQSLSAIMVDIDHFKQVNDRYGHVVGDRMLELVSHSCQDALRKTDFLGRYGGDEFIVLLPDTGRERAIQIAERLRAVIDELRFDSQNGPVMVTACIGVAECSGGLDSLEELIERADRGLYAAKQAGRNRVKFSELLPEPPVPGVA